MRVLLAAAVSLAAAAVPASGATPRTENLYTRSSGTISAFAQDGSLIAWFTPGSKSCNSVHVWSLVNPLRVALPSQQTGTHNVTCQWAVGGTPVALAIASETSNVLWTLHESSPLPFDYLVGAGAAQKDQREHRFQQLAHTNRGAGLWFGGVTGDGTTLAYAVTSVDYADEAGCLAGTDTCDLKIAGGGVFRIVGGDRFKQIPETTAAVGIAASAGRVAYIEAGGITKRGRPTAGPDPAIDVIDSVSGQIVSSIRPPGTPLAVALAPHVLATLERTPLGLRLAWYGPTTGKPLGSVPIAAATNPELSVTDSLAVFRVGRSIRAVELASRRVRTLIKAAATPVGLSIEGTRVAWAENLKHGARIRALFVG
ncbi:MAG TPA: hypothetical protein VIG35_04120 [Gaiellaceae bacterium]|jgi:hypothetical protein